jgi:hypothetical protein
MSQKIKIEIEIPAPPEGWGEVEWRNAMPGDYWFDCGIWSMSKMGTLSKYPVARKLTPLWTPPPEFSVLRPGWIAMNWNKYWFWFDKKPLLGTSSWEANRSDSVNLRAFELSLFPQHIPWDKSCFKIGEPDE